MATVCMAEGRQTSEEIQSATSHEQQANQELETPMRRECHYQEGTKFLATSAQVKCNGQSKAKGDRVKICLQIRFRCLQY